MKIIKNQIYKTVNIVLIAVLCFFCFNAIDLFAQDNDNKKNTNIQNVTVETLDENISKPEESDITTKIYKSTDRSSKLLDEKSTVETTVEDDIVSKEDLIRQGKFGKNKIYKRLDKKNKKDEKINITPKNVFMPWVALFLIGALLSALFAVLKKKKI